MDLCAVENVREAVGELDLDPKTSHLWHCNPCLAADLTRRLKGLLHCLDTAALSCLANPPPEAVKAPRAPEVQRWHNNETGGTAVRLATGEVWLREQAIGVYRLLLEGSTALEAETRLQAYGPYLPKSTGRSERWGPPD